MARATISGWDFRRKRAVFLHGKQAFFPSSFTRSYAVTPTPGGRWKVRQLRTGQYCAYRDNAKPFRRVFNTLDQALNYAHAQATVARTYSGTSKINVLRRNSLMREVHTLAPISLNKALIELLILEEQNDYYEAAREH